MAGERARALFDEIVSEGRAWLDRAKRERRQEDFWHDFKRAGAGWDERRLDGDSRKNLGVAISGFANSDGGVIIWGVDCRGRDRGVPDAVTDLVPIPAIERFRSELSSATPQVVAPVPAGVEHRAILGDTGSGFAVSFVPPMFGEPSMYVEERRYMRRTSSAFEPMVHASVSELFRRKLTPDLRIRHELVAGGTMGGPGGSFVTIEIRLIAQVRGAVARSPLAIFRIIRPSANDDRETFSPMPQFRSHSVSHPADIPMARVVRAEPGDVFFPGVDELLATFRARVPYASDHGGFEAEWVFAAEGATESGTVVVTTDQLRQARDAYLALRRTS